MNDKMAGRAAVIGIAVLALLAIGVAAAIVFSGSKPTGERLGDDLDGIWVRQKYLDAVQSARSPFAEEPEVVTIDSTKARLTWTNFHEGSWRRILGVTGEPKAGTLMLGSWEEITPRATSLELPYAIADRASGPTLSFTVQGVVAAVGEPFVKLNSPLEPHVNELLLVGEYTDQKGRAASFGKDHIAKWSFDERMPRQDYSFSYEVALDSSEAECPYIRIADEAQPGGFKRYGYRSQRTTLELFEILYDTGVPIACAEQPFAVLTRRKS
jgi:hypothetical protein